MRLVKVKIKEQQPSFLVEHEDGIEATSNDGTTRIILRKTTVFENMEREVFTTTQYIREGSGWLQVFTEEAHIYNSKEKFIDALREAEGFYKAVDEYDQIHNELIPNIQKQINV